jgi:hypothetical protein
MLKRRRMVAAAAAGCILLLLAPTIADESSSTLYLVRSDRWTDADERGYEQFITAIGESDCASLDACLKGPANPFRGSDPPDTRYASDCSDLPYVLRFYYAWKRGLPFSYVDAVAPRDGSGDIRYARDGNKVVSRRDVPGGVFSGLKIIEDIRNAVSTGTYRLHPGTDGPLPPDLYSPAITPQSIRPGTVVYDPAGHVAIVYRVDRDGRVHSFDAHTDYSLTQMTFDVRFARMRPAQGSGFKNWRPIRLAGAERQPDGTLKGGHIEVARNAEIAAFSVEQFYGTGPRPPEDEWARGRFSVGGETLDYYDFVRARLAGGKLVFNPVKEVREMTWSICSDLGYRAQAVDLARDMAGRPHPFRLPRNIYGADGDWEMFSTPSRDARLKTAFKYLRDTVQRFVEMDRRKDNRHLAYEGGDLPADLLKAFTRAARFCQIQYRRGDGSMQILSLEEMRKRLFAMSFDPYHCPERRWGASDASELSTCSDGAPKQAWYAAEQKLRNQIDRTYETRMDFTLEDLHTPGPGKGAVSPPDTDVIGYLEKTAK